MSGDLNVLSSSMGLLHFPSLWRWRILYLYFSSCTSFVLSPKRENSRSTKNHQNLAAVKPRPGSVVLAQHVMPPDLAQKGVEVKFASVLITINPAGKENKTRLRRQKERVDREDTLMRPGVIFLFVSHLRPEISALLTEYLVVKDSSVEREEPKSDGGRRGQPQEV